MARVRRQEDVQSEPRVWSPVMRAQQPHMHALTPCNGTSTRPDSSDVTAGRVYWEDLHRAR